MADNDEMKIKVVYDDTDAARFHREELARIEALKTAASQAGNVAAQASARAYSGAAQAQAPGGRPTAAPGGFAGFPGGGGLPYIPPSAAARPALTGGGAPLAIPGQPPRAALPGPAAPGAVVAQAPGGWEVLAPGQAGGGAGGAGIPIRPTPVPGQPQAGGMTPGQRQAALAGTAVALGAVKVGVETAAQSQGEGNQHVAGLVSEMEATRASQREIAALRGAAPTGAFAAQMAREAANAGISTDQYQQFQTAFQAYAGQYIGNKLPRDQAERLQQSVAGYAVGSQGLAPADSARLLGTIVDKMKPGTSDEDILKQYGQSMKAMQLAPGYTGPLLGQLSEVVQESVGPNGDFGQTGDAAVLLRAISQRNPNSASAYTRALLRGLRRARGKPELAKELGLKPGQDIFQQIEAVGQASSAAAARGEDEGLFLEKHGFGEIRQFGGIQTALNAGIRGGAFERTRQEMAGVDAGTVRRSTADYLAGQEGGSQRDRGLIEAARLDRANHYAALQRIRRQAEQSLETSGELERGEGLGAIFTQAGRLWGAGDRREQETRAETARIIRQRLADFRGFPGARQQIHEFEQSEAQGIFGNGSNMRAELRNGRYVSDENLAKAANFLERLVKIAEQQQRQRESGQAAAAATARQAPPVRGVSVRQPEPAGRMEGKSDSGQGSW